MIDAADRLPTVEPDLLVATWAADGTPTFCNPAWRSIMGPLDTPWLRLTGSDADIAAKGVTQAARGQLVTNCVVQAHTPNRDEPLPILLHFAPVYLPDEDNQRSVQAVSVVGEVMAEPASWTASQTQRHRLEALGRMTMGIAHDLNNLLSGLQGHIELLRETTPDASDAPALHESLSTIERVAEDGAALIHKLQQYIRDDQEVHFEPVNLTNLIEDCIALTQPYWYNEPRREGITIEVDRQLDEVPPIMGAASELREVFVNLILNAVQAMPDGGTITFQTTLTDDDHVRVEVADTGTGMPPDVRQHIFDPLFTTKGDRGTGMGLAVSHGIVQEHGGTIVVDTAPDEGTRFTLTFPASLEATPAPDAPSTSTDEPVSAARVLVVDDEEMVRNVVNKLLSLKGHTVVLTTSGPDALESAAAQRPDIVFTDYGMSEMNGIQLTHALRDHWPDLPIVLLTGEAEAGNFEQHVDRVLEKPFKLRELEDAIRDLVPDS